MFPLSDSCEIKSINPVFYMPTLYRKRVFLIAQRVKHISIKAGAFVVVT